jgi:hypothetical protein
MLFGHGATMNFNKLLVFAIELESVNKCAPFCLLNSARSSPLAVSSTPGTAGMFSKK